jgi:hypothetical protein
MKQFIFILVLTPLLTACPSSQTNKAELLKEFRANGHNFKKLKKKGYANIEFRIPETMTVDYNTGHVYKKTALTLREEITGALFTVEKFTEQDLATELMEKTVVRTDLLNSFQEAYVDRRMSSLAGGVSTFKKTTGRRVLFPGVIQTVTGERTGYEEPLYYAVATLKVENEYYLFQFIASRQLMAYVYDDFEHILSSVRKIK